MRATTGAEAVAIDGPAASGKSTVARKVAEALGALVVDSGAFYRGAAWLALREGAPADDPVALAPVLDPARWSLAARDGAVGFALDGADPGAELRGGAVREAVSEYAAVPEVRAFLVAQLRATVRFGRIVMEGRDIGTVVFPESRHKFYLDADAEERARRRLREIVALEGAGSEAEVQDSLRRRDTRDRSRATAPLQVALGAQVIDSTRLNADEVAAHILACIAAVEEGGDG